MDYFSNISQKEFDEIYNEHQLWLNSNHEKGKCANFEGKFLRNIVFPLEVCLSEAFLSGANLSGVNLRKAVLNRANLSGANLEKTDLESADLSNAILFGARLIGANLKFSNLANSTLTAANLSQSILSGVNFASADLSNAILKEVDLTKTSLHSCKLDGAIIESVMFSMYGKTDSNMFLFPQQPEGIDMIRQDKLKLLEKERDTLLSANKKNEKTITEKKEEIENLKIELEKRGEDIEAGLETSFKSLEDANKSIDSEICRLNWIFIIFILIAILLSIPLIIIWYSAFNDLRFLKSFEPSRLLIYSSPSIVLVALICGAIVEMNRAQRQLVSLCKFNRKYSVLKIALKGYYSVLDKHEKNPLKALETFDSIIKENIKGEFNTEKEEDKIVQMESKDAFIQQKAIDFCMDVLQKVKK